MGHDEHGNLYVASEMKALVPVCRTIKEFPAGSYLWSQDGEIREYYRRDWFDYDSVKDNVTDAAALRTALEESVKSHLMSDVPYGVLLSGGLDSSVISAITKKYAARRVEDQERSEAWWPQLHSFAVGLEGSPDLRAAQEVANHLGTVHHEIHFTVQEGLDAIRDVIYHIETYDVTTIRASTPMYLMSRKIKAMGIKMVLSGEGADEVFGGYLYFHKAPDAREFHEETVRKLLALHMFDCARANKAMSAWGVEARVPFLDKKFLDVAMRINPKDKMCGNGKWKTHRSRMFRVLFAGQRGLAPERAVLRRRRLQLDRHAKRGGCAANQRSTARNRAFPLPVQHADLERRLPVPRNLRGAVPAAERRRMRAGRPVRRLLVRQGHRMGRIVQEDGRSFRPRRRRAPGRL